MKELPSTALTFEKTFFNGIFNAGNIVKLKDLKDVLYISMNSAKKELNDEVDRDDYYVKYSRGIGSIFLIAGIITLVSWHY